MNLQELDALAKGLAPVVARLIEAAVAPLRAEILALRSVEAVMGPPGPPGERGDAGERGPAGADAQPVGGAAIVEALRAAPELIAEAVADHLAAHPPAAGRDGVDGKDGRDGIDGRAGADGAPGADGIDGKDGAPGVAGEKGAGGVGLAGALIDRDDNLVVTLTDGSQRALGRVVGRDGLEGKAGADGAPGRDGVDGLGFDDLDLSFDGERKLVAVFARGEVSKAVEIEFPVLIDRGVYKAERGYVRGDVVTWAGSLSIAQRDAAPGETPESSDAWRLAVRRGRDGRDGQPGAQGEPGQKGDPGRDGRTYS